MRTLKAIIIAILASTIGTAASCSSMGGGGMRYLVDPAPPTAVAAEI